MNKKKLFPITNTGTVSILTVFVILAMVAFALLAYMSARRGAGYSGQFTKEAQAWQEARSQALKRLLPLTGNSMRPMKTVLFRSCSRRTMDFPFLLKRERNSR